MKNVEVVDVTVLGRNVLVKQWAAVEKVGVLYVPEAGKEAPAIGRVVGRGHLCEFPVKVGDTVQFQAYAGVEVSINGEALLLMPEDVIVAVLHVREAADATPAVAA